MPSVLFTDDFERADGPLGNGWSAAANLVISSGRAHYTAGSANFTFQDMFNGYPDQALECVIDPLAGPPTNAIGGVLLRSQAATYNNAYRCYCYWATRPQVCIYVTVSTVSSLLVSAGDFTMPTEPFLFRAEAIGNVIQCYINGALVARAVDDTFASGRYAGMYLQNASGPDIDQIDFIDMVSEGILLSPWEVIEGSADNIITVTGLGTAWTPGTPGSPTFSASGGTITAQTVNSATEAELTYSAPSGQQQVLISADSPNLGARLAVNTKQLVSGYQLYEKLSESGSGGLSQTVIDQLTAFLDVMMENGTATVGTVLQFIVDWFALWADGGNPTLPELAAVTDLSQDILDQLTLTSQTPASHRDRLESALSAATSALAEVLAIDGNSLWTLGSIRDDIRGLGAPTIYDLQVLINALTVSGAWTLADIRDAVRFISVDGTKDLDDVVSSVEGTRGKTISDIADLLDAIQSAHGYTLESVMDAIAGIVAGSNADVLAELATIRTGSNYTLGSIMTALGGTLNTDLSSVTSLLNALTTNGANDLADILSAISGIPPTDLSSVLTAIGTHDTDVKALIGTPEESLAYIITRMWTDTDYSLPAIHDDVTRIMGSPERNLGDIFNTVEEMQASLATVSANVTSILNQFPIARSTPAAWPGASGVTFGDVQFFSGSAALNMVCDGALIELTTVPDNKGLQQIGAISKWRWLGWYAFFDDSGNMEDPRYLQWNKGIVTPTQMLQPAGIVIQCNGAIEGAVTPWTLNS